MELSAPPTDSTKRAVCARCLRPLRACYCAALPSRPLGTRRTHVFVLQHAREQRQRQAISSVPVLAQVLAVPTSVQVISLAMETTAPSLSVADALCAVLHEQLDRLVLAEAVERVFVLFPHADAQTLDRELAGDVVTQRDADAEQHDDHEELEKPVVLVVVDGTWHEAKKIVHHSRAYWEQVALHRRARGAVFEYVCLDNRGTTDQAESTEASQGSIYGELRKEPMEGCVSTLEAVAMALRVLEPKKSHRVCDALLSAFRAMVAIQSQFQQQGKAAQQARHGGTPKRKGNDARRPREEPLTSTDEQGSNSRGVAKPYVFYTTHTDFRKRQRLVQEGEVRVCTRDEAIALCSEMNATRARGSRVSTLPQEAFRRQQHELEHAHE